MNDSIKKELKWEEKPTKCSKCGGSLEYRSHGEYLCRTCGFIERDDFGKIRYFLDQNGPSPALVISEGTGVPIEKINSYLRQGRIEIPDGSSVYIKCESCGADIRFGRFCPQCALKLSKQLQGALEAGEVPKHKASENDGKMRFMGRNRDKR